jgi:ParB-like chromosome segregation protein Spo0J
LYEGKTKSIPLDQIQSSAEDITIKVWEERINVPFMKDHFMGWRKIPIESIRPDPTSPHVAERYVEETASFAKLVTLVKEFGISESIIVSETGAGDYLIIKGVCRFRSAMRLGLSPLVCLVYSPLSAEDRESLRVKIYTHGKELMQAARSRMRSNRKIRAAMKRSKTT